MHQVTYTFHKAKSFTPEIHCRKPERRTAQISDLQLVPSMPFVQVKVTGKALNLDGFQIESQRLKPCCPDIASTVQLNIKPLILDHQQVAIGNILP